MTATTTHTDFHRLAAGLRAHILDFNYHKTRKLLEPNWDGYNIPPGHDLIEGDVDLDRANLVTSQHSDDPDMHRIVLDLDYGASIQPGIYGARDELVLSKGPHFYRSISPGKLKKTLNAYGLSATIKMHHLHLASDDYALIPSSTGGHHHLILDVNLPWKKYRALLAMLSRSGIIESGYFRGALRREIGRAHV